MLIALRCSQSARGSILSSWACNTDMPASEGSAVEEELLSFTVVANAAALAVEAEFGEDEVLAVVEPKPEHRIVAKERFEFLVPRFPPYMLPRFIRVMEKMPHTEIHKV